MRWMERQETAKPFNGGGRETEWMESWKLILQGRGQSTSAGQLTPV